MQLEPTNIYNAIDPHLQLALERRSRGQVSPFTASTERGELAVIAKVTDLAAWEARSEVRPGAVLGQSADGAWLVTARIPLARVEAVRAAREVESLKPAKRLRPVLAATVEEIRARGDLLPADAAGGQGAEVVVGTVDFGADFAHRNFRHADGTTRLRAIWDQTGPIGPNSPFGYGRLYGAAEIDAALTRPNPYTALGYAPPPDSRLPSPGTHGTHVMDIAAGNGGGTGLPGVAPAAELVFVEISSSDIPWTGPGAVGSSFGDSVQLLEAIVFVFDHAGDRPCVVNVSLGTNGGPHDGTTLVEQGIDALIRAAPNRAVVIAAANAFADGIHAAGHVPQDGAVDLGWVVQAGDPTDNEIEIWYPGGDEFRLELIAPDGTSLGTVDLGASARATDAQGRTVLFVAHRGGDPNNGDNVIGVFVERRLPAGRWTLRLHGVRVADGAFHAWIERDDAGQSFFAPPHDNSHTLGSISCGRESIVVGSYDAHKPSTPLSFFSGSGPTRDGREKPEVSAPGHHVLAAHSRTGTGLVRKSGTSMAAPAATGLVALMLAEARARGIDLTTDQIRGILASTARQNPPAAGAWDPRYGAGRVDAHAAVAAVAAMVAEPLVA